MQETRPSSLDDGGISGLFSSGGPSVRFLTRYDGEVSEPSRGAPGKSGLHASGEGERVIAPEPWEGTLASRRPFQN